MQKYKPKTPLAGLADRVLRLLLTAFAGIAWFVYLWGLSLPSLTAGVAMGGLLWLCTRQLGKKSVQKREKQMRRMIGGELALTRLLTMPPRHAAFQAALWIAPKAPVCMQKAIEWGVLGTLEGQPVLIHLIAQHDSLPVTVQQIIEALRETRRHGAERCILCLTAPASREALCYALTADPPVTLFDREELLICAGMCSPATDEELSRLGKRKQMRRSPEGMAIHRAGRIQKQTVFLVWHRAGCAGLADGAGILSPAGRHLSGAVRCLQNAAAFHRAPRVRV